MFSLPGSSNSKSETEQSLALLALSHTPDEQQLFTAMLNHVVARQTYIGAFTTPELLQMANLRSALAIKRALQGLVTKLSIEEHRPEAKRAHDDKRRIFQVFHPLEIFARRYVATLRDNAASPSYPPVCAESNVKTNLQLTISRMIKRHRISCREAEIALSCIEGLTNAEIGRRLQISEQTVKFHLSNIFMKCGVKRRVELVSHFFQYAHADESINNNEVV